MLFRPNSSHHCLTFKYQDIYIAHESISTGHKNKTPHCTKKQSQQTQINKTFVK